MEQNIQKYRGARSLVSVSVIEGDGKNFPFERVDYVLQLTADGGFETVGKIVPLTEKERGWFNEELY